MWVFSFFEKVKIAAIAAVAQRLGAGKAQLPQSTVGHVIHLAEQGAQLRAAVFHAGRVPEALFHRDLKVVFTVGLRALPQIALSHHPQKNAAIQEVKARNGLHFCRGGMLFRCNDLKHRGPHGLVSVLVGKALRERLVQRDAGENRLGQRFHLIGRLALRAGDTPLEQCLLPLKQRTVAVSAEFFA